MFPFIPVIVQHKVSGEILLLAYLSKGEWKELQKGKNLKFYFDDAEMKWLAEDNGTRPISFIISEFTEDVSTAALLILALPDEKKETCYLSPFGAIAADTFELYRLNSLIRYHAKSRINRGSTHEKSFSEGSLNYLSDKIKKSSDSAVYDASEKDITEDFINYLLFLSANDVDLITMTKFVKERVYNV